jgi:hypothetical protein
MPTIFYFCLASFAAMVIQNIPQSKTQLILRWELMAVLANAEEKGI